MLLSVGWFFSTNFELYESQLLGLKSIGTLEFYYPQLSFSWLIFYFCHLFSGYLELIILRNWNEIDSYEYEERWMVILASVRNFHQRDWLCQKCINAQPLSRLLLRVSSTLSYLFLGSYFNSWNYIIMLWHYFRTVSFRLIYIFWVLIKHVIKH